jgi:hypothetical protein
MFGDGDDGEFQYEMKLPRKYTTKLAWVKQRGVGVYLI